MNPEPIIRDYRPYDYPEVENLWIETGMGNAVRGDDQQTIAETLQNGGKLFILEDPDSGRIIGTSWLTNDKRRIYMHHFGILPSFQGKGYSKNLLKHSLQYAKSTGKQIKIEVHQTNTKAIQLYLKAGFKYLGDYNVYIIRNYNDIES